MDNCNVQYLTQYITVMILQQTQQIIVIGHHLHHNYAKTSNI